MEIDRLSFANPWPASSYAFELTENRASRMLVLDMNAEGRVQIIGFVGYWLVVDEAHISTFAIHPDWRGKGWARALLVEMLTQAARQGAGMATLEVREGNAYAKSLYLDLGFELVGRRKGYYQDNGEDALLMTTYRLPREEAAERQARTTGAKFKQKGER